MKILHILNALLPSGAETMLKAAAKYWDSNDEHHILATASEIGHYAEELRKAGYLVHHINCEDKIKWLAKIKKFIREEKFDVVHVHRESKALYFEMAAYAGGARCVLRTIHNIFEFTGFLRLRRIVTRQIACLIGVKHVAIGESVRENEKKRFFVNCATVNNWYDDSKFTFTDEIVKKEAKEKLKINDNQKCIVSVGNCSDVKNHLLILDVLKQIKEMDIVYLHVGEGNLTAAEKEFVAINGIKRVGFLGYQDPLLCLQASDVYLMPSKYEGFSISALEAIATGMPCLLTEVPGLRDLARSGFENVVYCKLDVSDMYDKLIALLTDEDLHNSREQSELTRSIYGVEQGVAGYQRLYGMAKD